MAMQYNFVGSWQLIPEKSVYSKGVSPKSMTLKIAVSAEEPVIFSFDYNWFTHDQQSYTTHYNIALHEGEQSFEHSNIADSVELQIKDYDNFVLLAHKNNIEIWNFNFCVNARGYLEVKQRLFENGELLEKFDLYHKQLSVLPYASSMSGVAIIPNQEGVIKHKALQAMAEQTDMHLLQIKQQIELLASQAYAIQRRKELSLKIYNSRISFVPQIGQTYYLYQKKDETYQLSLVAPHEWGRVLPFKGFEGAVKLLADHTWESLAEEAAHSAN